MHLKLSAPFPQCLMIMILDNDDARASQNDINIITMRSVLSLVAIVGYCKYPYRMSCICLSVCKHWTPKPTPIADFAAEFFSAENPPNKTNIRIIKWNQHSNKWLGCYLKWIILVISKLLVITDGFRFVTSKKRTTTTTNTSYALVVFFVFFVFTAGQASVKLSGAEAADRA